MLNRPVLASGSQNGNIILWNVEDVKKPELSLPLTAHTLAVTSLKFSPSGNILASGSEDKSIILWDIETNIDAATRTLPEGRTELTWDRSTRSPIIPPLRVHRDSILSLAFSKDNKTLVSGSKDGTIILWDISKRQAIGQPLTGYQQLEFDWNNIEKIGFNQDSNVLVIMNKEGANLFWNLRKNEQLNQPFSDAILWNNPKEQYKPNAKEKQQLVKTVSQDGKISASANGSQIILGDVATNQPIGQPLLGTQSPITHLAFSPDSKMLISISEDSVRNKK
jgi:WD40 repeat protein